MLPPCMETIEKVEKAYFFTLIKKDVEIKIAKENGLIFVCESFKILKRMFQ